MPSWFWSWFWFVNVSLCKWEIIYPCRYAVACQRCWALKLIISFLYEHLQLPTRVFLLFISASLLFQKEPSVCITVISGCVGSMTQQNFNFTHLMFSVCVAPRYRVGYNHGMVTGQRVEPALCSWKDGFEKSERKPLKLGRRGAECSMKLSKWGEKQWYSPHFRAECATAHFGEV